MHIGRINGELVEITYKDDMRWIQYPGTDYLVPHPYGGGAYVKGTAPLTSKVGSALGDARACSASGSVRQIAPRVARMVDRGYTGPLFGPVTVRQAS